MKGHVDESWRSFAGQRVRVAVIDRTPDGTWVYAPDESGGRMQPLNTPDGLTSDPPWTLDVPEPVARALYEALRARFDGPDPEPLKALTIRVERADGLLDNAESRRAVLENALIDALAMSATR